MTCHTPALCALPSPFCDRPVFVAFHVSRLELIGRNRLEVRDACVGSH